MEKGFKIETQGIYKNHDFVIWNRKGERIFALGNMHFPTLDSLHSFIDNKPKMKKQRSMDMSLMEVRMCYESFHGEKVPPKETFYNILRGMIKEFGWDGVKSKHAEILPEFNRKCREMDLFSKATEK